MARCKICRDKYTPIYNSLSQKTCLKPSCLADHGRQKVAAQVKKDEVKRKQEMRVRKIEITPLSEWMQRAQVVFNTWVRMRDKAQPCISCDTRKDVQYCAGHYFTRGAHPQLRFDPDNVHKQCNKNCNLKLSGNIVNYRPRLINRIGQERFDALESRKNDSRKYTIPEIKELITHYRNEIKKLK